MRPRPSQPNFWQRSQTKAWAFAQLAGSGILASISGINSFVSSPEVKDYLNTIDAPKMLILAIATMGLLTYIFHGHDDA